MALAQNPSPTGSTNNKPLTATYTYRVYGQQTPAGTSTWVNSANNATSYSTGTWPSPSSAPSTGTPSAGAPPTGVGAAWGTGVASNQTFYTGSDPVKTGYPKIVSSSVNPFSTAPPNASPSSTTRHKGYILTINVEWQYGP